MSITLQTTSSHFSLYSPFALLLVSISRRFAWYTFAMFHGDDLRAYAALCKHFLITFLKSYHNSRVGKLKFYASVFSGAVKISFIFQHPPHNQFISRCRQNSESTESGEEWCHGILLAFAQLCNYRVLHSKLSTLISAPQKGFLPRDIFFYHTLCI